MKACAKLHGTPSFPDVSVWTKVVHCATNSKILSSLEACCYCGFWHCATQSLCTEVQQTYAGFSSTQRVTEVLIQLSVFLWCCVLNYPTCWDIVVPIFFEQTREASVHQPHIIVIRWCIETQCAATLKVKPQRRAITQRCMVCASWPKMVDEGYLVSFASCSSWASLCESIFGAQKFVRTVSSALVQRHLKSLLVHVTHKRTLFMLKCAGFMPCHLALTQG